MEIHLNLECMTKIEKVVNFITPSAMGLYLCFKSEIFTDNSFKEPINVILGHDGSKTVAPNDIHDLNLLEFEKRVWNGIDHI